MFGYSIGIPEIILILFVALLLFGAKRLPEIARSLGKSIAEFKKGMTSLEDMIEGKEDTDKKEDKTKGGPAG